MTKQSHPKSVAISVWLFVGSIILGAIKMLFVPVPGPLWIAIVTLIILLAFAFALWSRQNWARFVLLIFFLIGLPIIFSIRQLLNQQGTFSVSVLVIQTLMQAASIVYSFLPSSNMWFRQKD